MIQIGPKLPMTTLQMINHTLMHPCHDISPCSIPNNQPHPGIEKHPLDMRVEAEMSFHSYQIDCGRNLFEQNKIPETSAELQNFNLFSQEKDMIIGDQLFPLNGNIPLGGSNGF